MLLAGLGLISTALATTVDFPVARWAKVADLPGDIRRLVDYAEVFGHGLGVMLIILTASTLDRRGSRHVIVLFTYSLGSGLIADVFKILVARHRPYDLDLATPSVQSFIGWLPGLNSIPLEPATTSFPSAHTATAVGLALGLSRFYPNGRWLFALFAALAAFQRIFEYAHFVSDVVFGATIAFCLGSFLALPRSFASQWLQPNDNIANSAD